MQTLKTTAPDTKTFARLHDFACVGKAFMPLEWDKYFTFAFVRNPWDRLVSSYSKACKIGEELSQFERSNHRNKLLRMVWERSNNFEDFLYNCTDKVIDYLGTRSYSYNQLDYITDKEGKVIVDFVGRFENLKADFTKVAQQIQIPTALPFHSNASEHLHYSSYYTPETEELVRKRFQKDIDFFGYTFKKEK